MLDVVNATIFCANDEIRFAVLIEITGSRTGSVAGDVSIGEIAHFLQHDLVLTVFTVAIPGSILRVYQDIEAPIAIPVDDIKLVTATAPGGPGVQLDGLIVLINEL